MDWGIEIKNTPLSLSGIIVGSALAFTFGGWDLTIFTLAISTTILFQVLSNLANDLGDSQREQTTNVVLALRELFSQV